MLGTKILKPGRTGAAGKAVKRSVAFTQGDDVLFGNVGKKFAEAPHAALVEFVARSAAAEPESFEECGIESILTGGSRDREPSRKTKLQQVAANGATEILLRGIGSSAAGDAA